MPAPANARFTASHEWILTGQDISPVGITDHAQSELGDIVYIELPEPGRKVKAKESVAVIESVKAASDIYSPVSGEIVEVNPAVTADPGLINRDPFGEGWLFRIRIEDPAQLEGLKDEAGYLADLA